MNQILGHQSSEVSPDGSGRGLHRIGGTHHLAHHAPRVTRPFHNRDEHRASAHEGDKIVVEVLADVLGVVVGKHAGVEGSKLGRDESQALVLEATDDLAHETALDRVGLADDQRAIHGGDATAHSG